jgi:UDP-N-acetylmuramoylalanine--D-glutamate ligase
MIIATTEVVKSPGIADKADVIQKLKARNVPIISELEYGARFTDAKFIAITGSNGKTTTTLLTYHLMKEAGFSVGLGGNIGKSLARQVIDSRYDWYVLEVSSFQLDNMYDFHADIAVLCNITPDHLDRYEYVFQNYVDSKFKIVQNQTAEDTFITFKDGGVVEDNFVNHSISSKISWMSLNGEVLNGAWVKDDFICINSNGIKAEIAIDELPIQGKHNQLNVMAAVMAALNAGVGQEAIKNGLKTFINAPHRLEKVAEKNGVTWINDSKATNVDSVKYALDSYSSRIIWIAGGVDKGNDYGLIAELVLAKVKNLIVLGTYKEFLDKAFGRAISISFAENMEVAVRMAYDLAKNGDIVLLSPACASFDLFRNYEHRGDEFRRLAKAILNS